MVIIMKCLEMTRLEKLYKIYYSKEFSQKRLEYFVETL